MTRPHHVRAAAACLATGALSAIALLAAGGPASHPASARAEAGWDAGAPVASRAMAESAPVARQAAAARTWCGLVMTEVLLVGSVGPAARAARSAARLDPRGVPAYGRAARRAVIQASAR